ncbi:MAG TPA: Fic family protein [Patescibacteria group bacterium]
MPNKFPPEFEIPNDTQLQNLQYWAGHYLAKLDGITQILPDLDFFIFMYVRKEAALSSQIEGTKATMVDAIQADAKLSYGLPEDVSKIQHYIEAMNYGLKRLNSLPLSLRLIRETHAVLLSDPEDRRYTPGEFRKTQNWIGGATVETARFVPPPPYEMMKNLSDFELFLHSEDGLVPIIKAALAHAQFETIHPFLDGNGRTGRLLITFYLCKLGVLEKPVLYLSEYFKKNRDVYFDLLHNYHQKGEIIPWVKFFMQGVSEVAKDAIETSKKINALREQDILKIQSLRQSSEIGMKMLQKLYKLPIVDVNKISEWSGYTRQGADKLIKKLVKIGILEIKDQTKEYGRKYVYKKYLDIFK